MGNKFNRFSEVFLIGLVSLPVVLFLALIVAAVLMFSGVAVAIILVVVVLIVLLVPFVTLLYFLKVYNTTYQRVTVTVRDERHQKHEFVLDEKIRVRDWFKRWWKQVKDLRNNGQRWKIAIQKGSRDFYENDVLNYIAELIETRYGYDARELFKSVPIGKIDIRLE